MLPSVRFNTLVSSVLLAAIPAVPGPIPTKIQRIKGPTIIAAPGQYLLTKDFAVKSGVAISIQANHVTLDLGGHSITHLGTGTIIQAECGPPAGCFGDLRVTNGTLVGGAIGISLHAEADAPQPYVVDHVTAKDQGTAGLVLSAFATLGSRAEVRNNALSGAPSGLRIENFEATIDGNTVSRAGTGVWMNKCNGSVLTGNALTDNETGLYVDTSYDLNVVSNLIARNNRGVGSFENYYSLWSGNEFSGNTTSGMSMLLFRENTVEGNSFLNNGTDGFNIGQRSEVNSVRQNMATGNGGCGIAVDCTSTYNAITDNQLSGNGTDLCLPDPCLRH